jgi:prepilin-type N-terminal cleavage/methylation domain-containing protein
MQKHLNKQQGFTLIEIAIVLVIIGLLLGGVLKGQEMIENGRAKNIVNDMNGITAAVNAYRDRYHGLPGDEAGNLATTRGWAVNSGGGNGNGLIGNAAASPFGTPAGEQLNFWRSLRSSGLLSGNPAAAAAAALPTNPYGGVYGVSNGLWGLTGNVLCTSNLPAKTALAVENQLDDGVNNTGSIRASGAAASPVPAAAAPAAQAFLENSGFLWTVCRQF